MSDADTEREWWNVRAKLGTQMAVEIIAADESAWSGPVLEDCIAKILPALQAQLTPGARILDLGCGIGRLTIPLAARFPRCTWIGVDISEAMLELALERSRTTNVWWLLGDGRSLPALEPLHGAYSMITFQHLPRAAQLDYITQVGVQLVPGAAFCFQVLEGAGGAFLWHQLDVPAIEQACSAGGLKVETLERVRSNAGDDAPVLWVTARKT